MIKTLLLLVLAVAPLAGAAEPAAVMRFGDTSRTELPYAKDPSVIKFQGQYLLYYSIKGTGEKGWAVGIARSDDLVNWKKVGELLPMKGTADEKGLAAPGARVLGDKVHLFYQSYTAGPHDAVCHAVSSDGIHFDRDPANPVFHPHGAWSVGRAIDAEVFAFEGRLYLYYATRDPKMKVQMLGVASADLNSDFGPAAWTDLSPDGPMLRPQLPWEKDCLEAPSVCRHGENLYLFYAGAYNNSPQQIGCAVSKDAIHWTRLSDQPLLANGKPGEWNSSESGHPGIFVDDDGQTYLFFQGNNDQGKSWYLSFVKIGWKDDKPFVQR